MTSTGPHNRARRRIRAPRHNNHRNDRGRRNNHRSNRAPH
jgi:hypothetical protein